MAKLRTNVRMIEQIRILIDQGHSIRHIAKTLKMSRKTIRKFLKSNFNVNDDEAPTPTLTDPRWIELTSAEFVASSVSGQTQPVLISSPGPTSTAAVHAEWVARMDWEKLRHEVCVRGTTVKQLHQEYAPELHYTT